MSEPNADTEKSRPMLFGGLTLEQYAEVVAHLLHFSAHDQSEVLARFQLDDASFRVVEWGFRIALIEETMQFRTRSLKTFTKTVKATRRQLEDDQPELDAVGRALGEAASDVSSNGGSPSEEPTAAEAEPVEADPVEAEADATSERAPDMPTYAITAARAAFAPPARLALPTSVAQAAAEVSPPAMVVHPPAALLEDSAAQPDDAQTAEPASVSVLTRLETMTLEVPPEVDQHTGALPFKAATETDAPGPESPPTLDAETEPPVLTRTSTVLTRTTTVVTGTAIAPEALPFEPTPAAAEDEPLELAAVSPTGLDMTIEQYASLCAETAVDPARSAEIEKRYGLSGNARRELDSNYSERFGEDAALQAKFKQLSERFRAWLVKSGAASGS